MPLSVNEDHPVSESMTQSPSRRSCSTLLRLTHAKALVLLFWRQETQVEELDKMQQYLTSRLPPLPPVSVDGALVIIYLIGRVFLLKS